MIFAAMKRDLVFRRIFGPLPAIPFDLRVCTGDMVIEAPEYLPSEQRSQVPSCR